MISNREEIKKWGEVLKLIAAERCNSRIKLSKYMGLAKPAIFNMVAERIEQGLLEDTQKQENMEIFW